MNTSKESGEQGDSKHFDPLASERLLRETNPAFAAALERADGKKDELFGAAVKYVLEVSAEVAEMPIAARFRTDKGPNFDMVGGAEAISPLLAGLSEAEFKRAQLQSNLQSLARDISIIADRFRLIILDIEATKTEG